MQVAVNMIGHMECAVRSMASTFLVSICLGITHTVDRILYPRR